MSGLKKWELGCLVRISDRKGLPLRVLGFALGQVSEQNCLPDAKPDLAVRAFLLTKV